MRRILSKVALLFINHGNSVQDREKAISNLMAPAARTREQQEAAMFVRVHPNEPTDVPDWCAGTNTWRWAEQDETLVELKIKPRAAVAEPEIVLPEGEMLAPKPKSVKTSQEMSLSEKAAATDPPEAKPPKRSRNN
jgi:hypothetical protein